MPEVVSAIAFERSNSQEIFELVKKGDELDPLSLLSSYAAIPLSSVKDIEISFDPWKRNDAASWENSNENGISQTSFTIYLL